MAWFQKSNPEQVLIKLERLTLTSRKFAQGLQSSLSIKYDFIGVIDPFEWAVYTQVAIICIAVQDAQDSLSRKDSEFLKQAVIVGFSNTDEYGDQPMV